MATRPDEKAPLLGTDYETAIKGEYIVIFKSEVSDRDVELHKKKIRELLKTSKSGESKGSADYKIKSDWQMGKKFRGYAGILNDEHVEHIRGLKEVKYVEQNQVVHGDGCDEQKMAPWGLVRTTKRDLDPTDHTYKYNPEAGSGVNIYVIDTGVDADHPKFGGRVTRGADFADPPASGDPYGHGTGVAGVAIADTYGVARSATVIDVRVFNDKRVGTTEGVIKGIVFVEKDQTEKKKVANLSFGIQEIVQSINDAVIALVESGVHTAVSAGNIKADACNRSPASVQQVITVAASDKEDKKYVKSNYGTCVDIIAPGVGMLTTQPGGKVASKTGTSFAAPCVSGVIASILSFTNDYDGKPAAMKTFLKETSTKGKITGFPPAPATVNNLLYYACE